MKRSKPSTKRRNVSNKNVVTKNQMSTALHGRAVKTANDPPSTVLVPWNQVTVVTTASVTSTGINYISSAAVDLALRNQMNLPVTSTTPELAFRIKSVRLWATPSITSSDLNVVDMAPCDLVESSGITADTAVLRKWLQDKGTVVRPASVGYMWPIADVDRVFRSTQDEVALFVYVATSTTQSYIVYLDILWRPYNTVVSFSASALA